MQNLTTSDIRMIDGEPCVKDVMLGWHLGYKRARDIRDILKDHRDELASYGEMRRVYSNPGSQGGRPALEYWLTEEQAYLACMFSRTAQAAIVRREIVDVFAAWRRRKAEAKPQQRTAARHPTASRQFGANPLTFAMTQTEPRSLVRVEALIPMALALSWADAFANIAEKGSVQSLFD